MAVVSHYFATHFNFSSHSFGQLINELHNGFATCIDATDFSERDVCWLAAGRCRRSAWMCRYELVRRKTRRTTRTVSYQLRWAARRRRFIAVVFTQTARCRSHSRSREYFNIQDFLCQSLSPSLLWHGCLGDRKGIWPVKAGCWFVGGDDLTGALHIL